MEPFRTDRLRLRPLVTADLPALHAIYAAPEVARWIGVHAEADTRRALETAAAAAQDGTFGVWAIEERATGRFLGDGGLQPLEGRRPRCLELAPDPCAGTELDASCSTEMRSASSTLAGRRRERRPAGRAAEAARPARPTAPAASAARRRR